MSTVYEYERYICNPDNLKETLEEYGVAIIPSVLNEEECDAMTSGMWDTLEDWTQHWDTQITRDNPESWKNIRDLFPKHSMLIQQYSLGHAQFIWNLRQNPKCVDIFAKLWGCSPQDLLVSFDAASFHMPPEVTKIGWHRKTWFHSDQSYLRNDFECIQSWATAFDVNDGDATLAVYEKSHSFHKDFAKHFNITDKDNWYKLENEEQVEFYKERGCLERYIKCPKGSMVFWDSRTIHCGIEPRKGREQQNMRCVVYLCYMPRSLSSEKELKKKIKAFEEMRMTSHWPCKVKLFPKMPRTYGAEVKEIVELNPPEINDLGRRLVGYN
jgi:hypothetical protein